MGNVFRTNNLKLGNIISYPDLIIREGTTFITGESGSGKSTLLRLFNATADPTGGKAYYQDQDINAMDTLELRKKVLLVGQNVYLMEGIIKENFDFYRRARKEHLLTERNMADYLEICCMDFDLNTSVIHLSGGERQRVFLAVNLSFLPEVIMLDEPTSALDEKTSQALMENIKIFCLEKRINLLVISHDKSLGKTFADDILVLERRK